MRLEKAGRCSRHKHRGALRGTPGSACPQPEPNATELPSCAPISARAAQRRRWRRRWRGEEDAHRPGPEGHKSCATSCGTSSAKSFATSFTTRPSRAHLSLIAQGKRGGRHACVGRGFRRWKMACATMNLHAPVLYGAQHVLRHVLALVHSGTYMHVRGKEGGPAGSPPSGPPPSPHWGDWI